MILGVAYYPEHWPQSRWQTDALLMKEAGISRVRIGEFAWHRMEPNEGQFDFAWLEEAVNLLGRHGIQTILGTPTPTYPAWLHAIYNSVITAVLATLLATTLGTLAAVGLNHHNLPGKRLLMAVLVYLVFPMTLCWLVIMAVLALTDRHYRIAMEREKP